MSRIRFSLITGTKGAATSLVDLLNSLAGQCYRDFELIIVDQNDDDRVPRAVEPFGDRFEIRHMRSAPGLSRARNDGILAARGDVVAFPDDDCAYLPETLETAAALFAAHDDLDFLTGITLDTRGRPSVSAFLKSNARVTRGNFLLIGNSNSLFFRRSVFAVVGGMDLRLGVGAATPFQSGDESDFILRCLDAGLSGHYFPQLVVKHEQVTTKKFAGGTYRAFAYGMGFGALLRKHGFSLPHLVYRAGRPLLRSGWEFCRGEWGEAHYRWLWTRGTVRGYMTWTDDRSVEPDPEGKAFLGAPPAADTSR